VPRLAWSHLGRVDYRAARSLQESLADDRRSGLVGDLLLLLEHPPVVTIGRNAREPLDGRDGATPVVPRLRVDRGGATTYHGPGQLVAYPVVALRSGGRGVRRFVEDLEEALCEAARRFGVAAVRRPGLPGAWVEGEPARKIGSVGIAIRRGVSLHGASLNVSRESARGFAGFDPCGLAGVVASSIEDETRASPPALGDVALALATGFARVAGYDGIDRVDAALLRALPGAAARGAGPPEEVPSWT